MDLRYNMVIDLYSMAIIGFILLYLSQSSEKRTVPYRIHGLALFMTLMMLTGTLFSWFDGLQGVPFTWFNHGGNFLVFLLNQMVPSLYFLYVHYQIHHDVRRMLRWMPLLVGINAFNLIMLLLSQFNGWYYTIDDANVYHRGPLFLVALVLFALLTLATFILVVTHRTQMERKAYKALVVFPLPPAICIVLQTVFYGISLVLHGVTFSLLIITFSLQNRSMHTDYLTGVYNRKKLESYLRTMIDSVTPKRSFSAIMIDLDNFKYINDTFGHDVGDEVLEAAAILMRQCLRTDDLIARYGGDEFYVVLDTPSAASLEAAVDRIRTGLKEYNQNAGNPYQLNFSMGYATYDPQIHANVEAFQKALDQLMYLDKSKKRTSESLLLEDPSFHTV